MHIETDLAGQGKKRIPCRIPRWMCDGMPGKCKPFRCFRNIPRCRSGTCQLSLTCLAGRESLFVSFILRNEKARVISARDMTSREFVEFKKYEKENS